VEFAMGAIQESVRMDSLDFNAYAWNVRNREYNAGMRGRLERMDSCNIWTTKSQ
jgi:hypothetical protein